MEKTPKYLFELMQDNIELAKYEVEQLLDCSLTHVFGGVYITTDDINQELLFRLAYTKQVCQIMQNITNISETQLNLPSESFKVTFLSENELPLNEREPYYDVISDGTNESPVSLTKPQHTYVFLLTNTIILTKQLFENKKGYWNRTPNKRPRFHPTSMSPKVAKAMINMAGPKAKVIHDPFCGTGGILIESLHNKLAFIAGDIDIDMLESAEINVKDDINKYPDMPTQSMLFELVSALETTHKSDAILSDVPYGKNTKSVGDIDTLYTRFLTHAHAHNLSDQIIFCVPDKSNLAKLGQQHGWKLKKEITEFVHKSLTRHILHFLRT